MIEKVKCNLCENDDYEVLYPSKLKNEDILESSELACTNLWHGRHYRIVRCKKCGLIYSNPRDKANLFKNFYKEVRDESYYMVSAAREKTFKRTLDHIGEIKKGKKLLDVGCYTGLFMHLARIYGWECLGIEPSEWASEFGKEKYKL